MKPKEYLNQIQSLEWSIYLNQEAIERVRSRLDIKGISYDKDKVQSSPEDMMPDMIAGLITLEEKNERKRDELVYMLDIISRQIDGMDDVLDKKILYKRYVKGMSLLSIAKEMSYSYDHIRHRHGVALQKFGQKYAPLHKIAHNNTFE